MNNTFIQWLQLLSVKDSYSGFESRFDWETQTLHLKYIVK